MQFKISYFAPLFLFLPASCQQSTPAAPKTSATEQAAPAVSQDGLIWAGDQDPVCEMKVDQTAADTVHYGGKIYGFCGPSCKESFQENPAKYVGK